jgi:hypothetical protein
MCRSNGVGMSEAIDLAVAEAEPPTGGEADTVLLCAVSPILHYYFHHYYTIIIFA